MYKIVAKNVKTQGIIGSITWRKGHAHPSTTNIVSLSAD
jgi:hypothetical protein